MGLITSNIIISGSSTSSLSLVNLPTASSLTNILVYNSASGVISYTASSAVGGSGSGTPGGSNTQIQYNNAGAFAGTASFAFIYQSQSLQQGSSVTASGLFSHAEGTSTQAIGNASHAEGDTTQAIGEASHAEGYFTQTGTPNAYSSSISSGIITLSGSYGDISGEFSPDNRLLLYDTPFDGNYGITAFLISQSYFTTETIIELYDTSVTTTKAYVGDLGYGIPNWTGDQTIPGNYSHSEGNSTQAMGEYSHAEGEANQAIGQNSHAEGTSTQAIGDASHAEGISAVAIGDGSHAEGRETQSTGGASHAEGSNTLAQGNASHAEGRGVQATGQNSHAEGDTTQARGYASHAEGYNTLAQGDFSHAEGYDTQALEEASHAEGRGAQAIGTGSHAEGYNTLAQGDFSHAEGDNTIASGSAQTVVGSYNTQNNTSSKFIVGIGDATGTRKDGFTVDVDANLSGSIMIPTNTANPSSPKTGSMYFNPSTNLLYIYNGTAWKSGSFA